MGDNEETLAPAPKPNFQSTQWSLVLAAQHRSTPDGRAAFASLAEKYWFPLYAFVRQTESDAHRARDLIQSFFEKVIEKNYIGDADPQRGRFRTFLLASLSNFMANEWKKSQTQKRGGGQPHYSIDVESGERWLRAEPENWQTPELLYERRWALAVLTQVLDQLKAKYDAADKTALFTELSQCLIFDAPDRYAEIAKRLNMTEGAVRVAAHRFRSQYREALRKEIAETLQDNQDVDDEIHRLFRTFSN